VFQGLLVSAPDQFRTPEKFIHLWLHESERVYGDRLVSYEDLAKYNTITQAQHKKVFPSYNVARFYSGETADPLIFCHFAENAQDKVYDMVTSITKLSAVLEDALKEYNEVSWCLETAHLYLFYVLSLSSSLCPYTALSCTLPLCTSDERHHGPRALRGRYEAHSAHRESSDELGRTRTVG
jgi:AAA+ lid domain